MKCLNCGKETDTLLCPDCQTVDVLETVFNDIFAYDKGTCENAYVNEYASTFEEKYAVRECVPQIINLFAEEIRPFYECKYHCLRNDSELEEQSLEYINSHDLSDYKTQEILFYLVQFYTKAGFEQPKKWCELISKTDALYCDLYILAAEYFGKIAEYDIAEAIINKALESCENDTVVCLFGTKETKTDKLNKLSKSIRTYRNGKPYWPITEDKRRALASIYDEKGIKYPRIKLMPVKINEDEFESIKEYEGMIDDYCAFWCSGVKGVVGLESIYQIAACKVFGNKVTETFQAYVKPVDKKPCYAAAAKLAGVSKEVIESAEDVDLVMEKFFGFVGDAVLVSTDALGNQAKLISRAARHSGMKAIKNEFLDLLDMADTFEDLDSDNMSREYLLTFFDMKEGNDSLEKAMANVDIYTKLKLKSN